VTPEPAATHEAGRSFKPNQRVQIHGTVVSTHHATGEYMVDVNGRTITLAATALRPVDPDEQLQLGPDLRDRLRQVANQLRDWQARLPAIVRECEALEEALRP
jgi:hypothetical protein